MLLDPIPEAIRARLVRVPAGRVQVIPNGPHVDVAEFWAYAGWFESEAVRERAAKHALSVDDSLEAVYGLPNERLITGQALHFARGASMRLPSIPEAARILEVTLAGESEFEPLPPGYSGEFCSSALLGSGHSHLQHSNADGPKRAILAVIDGGTPPKPGFAFRLAISRPPSTKEIP